MTQPRSRRPNLLLTLILVCVVLAITGWLIEALLWLFFAAVALFILTLAWMIYRTGQRRGRRVR